MCSINGGDHYNEKWKDIYPWNPWLEKNPLPIVPQTSQPTVTVTVTITTWPPQGPSREEFDDLKNEVEEMKKLLKRAVEYDKKKIMNLIVKWKIKLPY